MTLVSRHYERNPSHRGLVVIGTASAIPRLRFQTRKQRNSRAANVFILVGQIAQASFIERAVWNVIVLLEARKRSRISTRKPQRAIREDPFAVDHVADYFLDAPLAFGVTKLAASLRYAFDQ